MFSRIKNINRLKKVACRKIEESICVNFVEASYVFKHFAEVMFSMLKIIKRPQNNICPGDIQCMPNGKSNVEINYTYFFSTERTLFWPMGTQCLKLCKIMMLIFKKNHKYLHTSLNILEKGSCILISRMFNFNILSHLP